MSTASGAARARARALVPSVLSRPRLTIVPKVAARAPRIPFVILVVLVLVGGLVGLLLVNTTLQRGAYDLQELRGRSAALERQQDALELEVADLRQPQRVAQAALGLGMVSNKAPAFLDLEDGSVSGATTPAKATDAPKIGVQPEHLETRLPKAMPAAAGAGATESTGLVHVPKPRSERGSGAGSGAAQEDRSGDTPTGSTPEDAGQATNNSGNSG